MKREFIIVFKVDSAAYSLRLKQNCQQFVFYNNTANDVKIRLNGQADTNTYDYLVKANTMFVSPVLNFNEISYYYSSFSSGSANPSLYCYKNGIFTPNVSQLTAGS